MTHAREGGGIVDLSRLPLLPHPRPVTSYHSLARKSQSSQCRYLLSSVRRSVAGFVDIYLSVGEREEVQKVMPSVFTESDFSHAISSNSTSMMKSRYSQPRPDRVPATLIVDIKLSSSSKSRKRTRAGAHIQFPSSAAEGADRRVSLSFPG